MDLNQFIEWQKQDMNRMVTIEIGVRGNIRKIQVWAYDYKLKVGQIVQSVDEIDLEAKKAEQEKAEYERLRKKFEEKNQLYHKEETK